MDCRGAAVPRIVAAEVGFLIQVLKLVKKEPAVAHVVRARPGSRAGEHGMPQQAHLR